MTNPTQHFDSAAIQQAWQPLDWQAPQAINGEAARYARYYGIDFAQQLTGISHGFGYFDAAGFRVACHLWQPQHCVGTVLVGHGYFDHTGLYTHIIRFLLERRYNVVMFDLPGHGLSSGAPARIDDFGSYQTVVTACVDKMAALPRPWHWLSQSTGGAIAMDYLQSTPAHSQPFDKMLLLAPLVWPVGWGSGKYLHAVVRHCVTSLPRRFATNSHDAAFLDFLKHGDPLQARRLSVTWVTAWKRWLARYLAAPVCDHPLYIIQGNQDTTVDWKKNLPVIQQHFSHTHIHLIDGGFHQLVNESDAFRQQVLAQLACWLP